jgi:hypothetical protein
MERFPQMDLMMAETLIHAEKSGLLDTDFQECKPQDLVVTEGVVVTTSEEKSSPITKASCEDSSPN